MAAPAQALAPQPERNGGMRLDLKVALMLAVQLSAWIYTYGGLAAKVDALHEQVQELRVEINQLRDKR